MPLEFTTKANRRKNPAIPFTLDGEKFSFKPPKDSLLALAFMQASNHGEESAQAVKALFDYLDAGLSEEQAERIRHRLGDPKDNLDLETLGHIMRSLITEVAQRPTK